MPTKHRKFTLPSPSSMKLRFGMLLACFAWIMHVSMLLTPLWDKDAHLGHGICIKLKPVVSMAKQYQQIQADIEYAGQHLPADSAAFHLHHHPIPSAKSTPVPVNSIAVVDTKTSSKELHSKHHTENSDSTAIKHPSCDVCLSMTAVLVPTVFAHAHPALFELPAVAVTSLYQLNPRFLIGFLLPFTRAPPQSIFK